jgi:hypothetical protein
VRTATKIALGAAGVVFLYVRFARPRAMRWGATDEEATRILPGDTLEPRAGFCATHAITIDAPPASVWPWLMQMGSGRGGWYAIDRLDNGGVPSAEVIRPELQQLEIGDLIPMAVGREVGPRVAEIEHERRMLWRDPDHGFTWEWTLAPAGEHETRLLSRVREAYPPVTSPRILYAIAASTGDVFMAHRQLNGIKRRAERLFAATTATGRAER